MPFKISDWIHHPKFGDGQIVSDLADKFVIEFVTFGERLMLKSAITRTGTAPAPGFTFRRSRPCAPRFRVAHAKRKPAPAFDHLVECFLRVFEDGFESERFDMRERRYKQEAVNLLHSTLSKKGFSKLLEANESEEIVSRASRVIHKTNLIFRNEIIQFTEATKDAAFRRSFSAALFNQLYGSEGDEPRFNRFVDVLSTGSCAKWTLATYFPFLESQGALMFMKPSVVKIMAESLSIGLNYQPFPGWPTYCRLQDLAARVDAELRARGLKPHSGIDVQGFIWSSIRIEQGKYGKSDE